MITSLNHQQLKWLFSQDCGPLRKLSMIPSNSFVSTALNIHWFITEEASITNQCCTGLPQARLTWQLGWGQGWINNKGSAIVFFFDLSGQGTKRTLSPEPLQPYNPAVTSLVTSMRPAPRNSLYPLSNGPRRPNPSSRPSNSSPTSGILRGNPTLS